ncbi:SDH family Clp fold serine proteinase [Candidatus Binatus sp.]|uniref:SDH family Clp fold serine proteinase n=1 Tax=Candidatus Binatus sp. TaxID=2811406 RepID=UPI003BAEBAD2
MQLALQTQPGRAPRAISIFDEVRRKYLAALATYTGRPTILYATKWTTPGADPQLTNINVEDLQGFMEVMHGLAGSELDLIVHSPGGSAEAAEALVKYIRSRFDNVRVFVPRAAMSAATMLACSANSIVMGKHSFLGPIDPQFILQTQSGLASVPAHAIEEQFAQAKKECKSDPSLLATWLPIIQQYGPALIVQCRLARELSEQLVTGWLDQYMFAGQPPGSGAIIAKKLADHSNFKSHSRFIDRAQARALGLSAIADLETDQQLQDAVLSVFHAATHTFGATGCVKVIENNLGKTFLKVQQQFMMMPQLGQPTPTLPPSGNP